jgi:sigma-B regulation protein RsbU (phosphoserine phosphatase)
LWAQLLDGRSFRGTLVNRKRSGQLYWTEQTITPVTDDNGTITHFVSVLKDITELRRKHEQEVQMRLARDVQQQFYREPAAVPGLDIAAASYLADQTGGDYFDVIPAGPDAAYVAIGDASGHGLPSALVMALTRAYVRSLAAMQLDVADILTRLNTMLAQDLDESRFVTLLLGRVDACRSELSYANAGHVPGFILDGRDGVAATMPSTGPPLGFFPRAEFRGSRMPLAPHQLVLLVTDGVTESGVTTDHEFGAERAVAYARANCEQSARRIVEGLCQAAREFSPDATPADDITSMVVKVTGRA